MEEKKRYVGVNTPHSVIKTSAGQRVLGKWASVQARNSDIETDLVRDAFYAYFLASFSFVEEPHYSRKFSKRLLEWATESEIFKLSQTKTMGRMFTSGNAAYMLIDYLLKQPPIQEAMKHANDAEKKQDEADDKKKDLSPEQRRDLRQKAKDEYEKAFQKLEGFVGSPEGAVARAIANTQAKQRAESSLNSASAWGLEDGPQARLSMEEIERMLALMSSRYLEELVSQIGRAKGAALHVRNHEEKHEEVVITDAGFTKDILAAFPTQQLALIDPDVSEWLHLKTLAEYGTHGVMGMVKSSEPVRRGIKVFKVDTSGSMDFRRLILAKGLAIGLGRAAEHENESWLASNFGAGPSQQSKAVGTNSTPLEIMEFATHAFNSGTDFDAAIRDGLRIIEGLENPGQADLVMITDGGAGIRDDTKARLKDAKEKHGIRFMVLLVDTNTSTEIRRVADYCATILSAVDIERAATGLSKAIWTQQ